MRIRTLLPAALLLAACGDPTGPGTEPITELPRALTPAEQAIIGDANGFGLALLSRMAQTDDRANIILSPLSASMALGMTMNGAATSTFDAMRATLGFGTLSQTQINDAYRGLIDLLTGLDPNVRFQIANAIWGTGTSNSTTPSSRPCSPRSTRRWRRATSPRPPRSTRSTGG